jgi:hypothetical protein
MRFTFDHIGVYKHLNPRKSVLRKGGGGGETTTRQISMLPEYARPFYENMMERAEAESLGQYTPYEGERLAKSEDFADIGMSKDMIRNIATMDVPGLQDAMNQVGANIGQLGGISNQIGGLMPGMAKLGERMGQYADKEARQFTGDEVDQYMSPYMDAVVERQKRGARLDFDRGQAARDASAVQAGAFGGSRQAVSQYLAEEGLGDRLADIEATGRQQAFEQAAQQFGADRAAQMAQDQFGLGALQGQAGMIGQQLGALGQQAGIAGQQAGLAGQYAGLGGQQRAAGIQGAQLLDAIGRSEMGEAQAGMDLAYQDFLRQQNFNKDQLGFLSNILQGVPVSPSTQTTQFMPYNPMQQALGAGLTGLSLYRAMV